MLLLPYGLVPLALVERLFQRFPRLWIAPIFQLPITMYDMVTAPLQFFSNRSFAGARNPFDQIVSDAHSISRPLSKIGVRQPGALLASQSSTTFAISSISQNQHQRGWDSN